MSEFVALGAETRKMSWVFAFLKFVLGFSGLLLLLLFLVG